MMSSEKIRPEHLARTAFVYVRQSTVGQVRDPHESRRRQYELADHARRFGWSDVVVIDEDLGKSGATAAGRAGFQRLVADVSLGRAGAVLGTVASARGRSQRPRSRGPIESPQPVASQRVPRGGPPAPARRFAGTSPRNPTGPDWTARAALCYALRYAASTACAISRVFAVPP
jgi:hypothetical protein